MMAIMKFRMLLFHLMLLQRIVLVLLFPQKMMLPFSTIYMNLVNINLGNHLIEHIVIYVVAILIIWLQERNISIKA